MMKYNKRERCWFIGRDNDVCAPETFVGIHDALLALLKGMDPNFGITEHQGPILDVLEGMSFSIGQVSGLFDKNTADSPGAPPTLITTDLSYRIRVNVQDPCFGVRLIRALIFYIDGSAGRSQEETVYYALELLSDILPTEDALNEYYKS